MTYPASVNSAGTPVMRRFRLTFSKGEPVRYISHLDLMRTWERILRRAGLKLAHSQGFNPRPRLVFAAPLSVGVTSDAEIVDVVVEDELTADEILARVRPALPPGIELRGAVETPLDAPAVMGNVLAADYVVDLASATSLQDRLAEFLARDSAPYERIRKGVSKQSDMRPAVLNLWAPVPLPLQRERLGEGTPTTSSIGMSLRLDVEGASVRPEEVVAALDPSWQIVRVHRTALHLKDAPGTLTQPSPAAAGEDGGRHAA
ncbi:MAG TPA: TIGR03936 family radical SAM-associated protein [Chloroflexota bacterium]|nr:TIGR03936 family radical SAM-associated protein [Chloroflexota bacterium]